jgi:hypothetical protein
MFRFIHITIVKLQDAVSNGVITLDFLKTEREHLGSIHNSMMQNFYP